MDSNSNIRQKLGVSRIFQIFLKVAMRPVSETLYSRSTRIIRIENFSCQIDVWSVHSTRASVTDRISGWCFLFNLSLTFVSTRHA